ncbi:MAG TPA: hypothetical protein VHW25_17820 [Steroidobacteraceae bacterium]|jgi:hypothetical protein|nr:hypothetical protein [Steroidobacteraceae bacterium]
MNLYAGLFESMLNCCGRSWLRNGPVYTVAMVALGVGVSLNLLSLLDLLSLLGIVKDPYASAGALHPQRYVGFLLCSVFIANTLLARHQFSAGPNGRQWCVSAPGYLLCSAALFAVTLVMYLRIW